MNRSRITSFLSQLGYALFLHPLGSMITVILFLYGMYFLTDVRKDPDMFDPYIFIIISTVSTVVVITIFGRTKANEWTALNAGLLGTFFGLSCAYGVSAYLRLHGLFAGSDDVLSFVRSVLVVSPLWVFAGLAIEWWYFRKKRVRQLVRKIKHFAFVRNRNHRR